MNKKQALEVAKKISVMSMDEVAEASRTISTNIKSSTARAFLYEVIDSRMDELCNKTECVAVVASEIKEVS